MDQTQLQQKIAEFYQKLPPKAQTAFSSMQWMEALKTISAKYTLDAQQVQTLGTETTLVLLGINSIEQYAENLSKEITLPPDSIIAMLQEIGDSILKDIQPELDQAYEGNIKSIEAENKKEQIKADPKFSSLPMELQDAIARSDYQKKLYDIGTKYKLQIAKMATLEDLTVKFIRADISGSQYENSLALELDLEAGKARELATDVNEGVMRPIREIMKEATAAKDATLGLVIPDNDPVPLPPYSSKPTKTIVPVAPELKPMTVAPMASTTKTTNEMYAEHGIEILDDSVVPKVEKLPEKPIEIKEEVQKKEEVPLPPAPVAAPVPMPVENITLKESGIDVLKEKLDGITVSKQTVSDHSLGHDPYHEAI